MINQTSGFGPQIPLSRRAFSPLLESQSFNVKTTHYEFVVWTRQSERFTRFTTKFVNNNGNCVFVLIPLGSRGSDLPVKLMEEVPAKIKKA